MAGGSKTLLPYMEKFTFGAWEPEPLKPIKLDTIYMKPIEFTYSAHASWFDLDAWKKAAGIEEPNKKGNKK